MLELGPEVAGQFCVVVLIGKIKRNRVYKEDSQGIQLQKNISDLEVLPGYAGRKCAETRSVLLHHVLPVYYTLGTSLGPMKQYHREKPCGLRMKKHVICSGDGGKLNKMK